MTNAIVQQATSNGALNASHYQTFEMAKANDDILGGTDIAQIRASQARTRAEAQAIYKMMSEMDRIEDVATSKSELLETSQLLAKYSVYGDQRIGEILRAMPTMQGKRTDTTSVRMETEVTKSEAIKNAGIAHQQAIDLQKMAANPEVVEAVIAKAEFEGRIVSRSQVLKAIKERDAARDALEEAYTTNEVLEASIANLEQRIAEKPEPEVIERTVEIEVESEDARKRIRDLEHDNRVYAETDKELRRQLESTRKELDRAKGILGMDESTRDVQRDVEYLISATNQYVRHYGGLTWTFERIGEVNDVTRGELRKAIKNLATFSAALVAGLEEM